VEKAGVSGFGVAHLGAGFLWAPARASRGHGPPRERSEVAGDAHQAIGPFSKDPHGDKRAALAPFEAAWAFHPRVEPARGRVGALQDGPKIIFPIRFDARSPARRSQWVGPVGRPSEGQEPWQRLGVRFRRLQFEGFAHAHRAPPPVIAVDPLMLGGLPEPSRKILLCRSKPSTKSQRASFFPENSLHPTIEMR